MDPLFYAHGDGGRAWSILNEGPTELYFIGASVTSQREGWADALLQLARSRSGHAHTLTKNAMGGVGLLFGVANYAPPPTPLRRLAFIEFSTGDLNLGLTPLDCLDPWLRQLVARARADGLHVVIVHNWRGDFPVDDAPGIRRRYDAVAADLGVPVIANHQRLARLLEDGSTDRASMFRDVCHTQPAGADVCAEHTLRCLEQMALDGSAASIPAAAMTVADAGVISFLDLPADVLAAAGLPMSVYTYPTTQQSFDVWHVDEASALELDISGSLRGVSFLSGPRTGWVDLSIDGKHARRFRCFDRNSHYERYILLPSVFELSHARVRIACSALAVDFAIATRPHADYALPRLMKIVQLAGADLVLHAAAVVAQGDAEGAPGPLA